MVNIDCIGRLGSNAELKQSQKGTQYVQFSLATDEFVNGKTETSWLSVVATSERAVKMAEYLKKGSMVNVRGTETIRKYTNKLGEVGFSRDVIADRIDFVSSGKREETKDEGVTTNTAVEAVPFGNSGTFNPTANATPAPATAMASVTTNVDDDLPF